MKDYWSLVILVILLFALGLVAMYQYYQTHYDYGMEGFLAFQKNTQSFDYVTIDKYNSDKKLCKLYDNLYFDERNGNVIELQGDIYDASLNNVSTDSNTLKALNIIRRNSTNGHTLQFSTTTASQTPDSDSLVNELPMNSMFSQWMKKSIFGGDGEYAILYIAWKDITFIDIIDYSTKPAPTYVLGALFDKSVNFIPSVPDKSLAKPIKTYNTDTWDDSTLQTIKIVEEETKYRSFVEDLKYGKNPMNAYRDDKNLFRITNFLHYDTENGNIVFVYDDHKVEAFARYDMRKLTKANTLETKVQSVTYNVFSFQMNPQKGMQGTTPVELKKPVYLVYYIAFGQNTMIVVVRNEGNEQKPNYTLLTAARFDATGYVAPPRNEPRGGDFVPQDDHEREKRNEYRTDDEDIISHGMGAEALLAAFMLREEMKYLNDNYIPKSQLIPPVFPVIQSCPSCSSDGSCSKHGHDASNNGINNGNNNNGNNNNNNDKPKVEDGITSFSNNTVNAATGLVNNLVNGTVDLAKSAGSGVVGFAKDTAGGAVDLTKQAVGGTVDLTKQAVGGTVDLTKQAVGGTVDLTKQAVNGIANIGGIGQGQVQGQSNGQVQGITTGSGGTPYGQYPTSVGLPSAMPAPVQYNTGGARSGVDGYSFYGASRNVGTSDFQARPESLSAFGK